MGCNYVQTLLKIFKYNNIYDLIRLMPRQLTKAKDVSAKQQKITFSDKIRAFSNEYYEVIIPMQNKQTTIHL